MSRSVAFADRLFSVLGRGASQFHIKDHLRKETTASIAIQTSATSKLNLALRIFFSEFVRVSLRRPSQALFFARTALWQAGAARLHARNAREGLTVPPIAIFSITNGCNLRFKGC